MLEDMLAVHPAVYGYGEGHFYSHLARTVEKALDHNLHHHKQHNERRGVPDPLVPFSRDDQLVISTVLFALQLGQLPEAREAKVITETSPDKVGHLAQIAALLPQARFILILRDGRDAMAASIAHEKKIAETGGKDWNKIAEALVPKMPDIWARQTEKYLDFAQAERDRCLVVKYESFFNDPIVEMEKVLSFLDLPLGEVDIEETRRTGGFGKKNGQWRRDHPNPSKHQDHIAPGCWKMALPTSLSDRFMGQAGRVMERADYRVSGDTD
jgi:hypothetical protein